MYAKNTINNVGTISEVNSMNEYFITSNSKIYLVIIATKCVYYNVFKMLLMFTDAIGRYDHVSHALRWIRWLNLSTRVLFKGLLPLPRHRL